MSREKLQFQPFAKAAIVGVGLLGASMGAALKKRDLCRYVIGVGRNRARLRQAQKNGCVDAISVDLEDAVQDCDLVVIATPVDTIVPFALRAWRLLGGSALVTDVGSSKAVIMQHLRRPIRQGFRFVGSHPIAGKEKQGAEHMTADLFHDRPCVLTPVRQNRSADIRRLASTWTALGARVTTMTAARHDRVLAHTSHLPHLAAAALVHAIPGDMLAVSGSGLLDATRIASGNPEMWTAILDTNAKNVSMALRRYLRTLSEMAEALDRDDAPWIRKRLWKAKTTRDRLPPCGKDGIA